MKAISFEHVSKMYRLGLVGTGTISQDLKRWWAMSVRGKEDPFLRVGETNDRTSAGSSDFVYALRDINFDVEQGDVIGIIGKNGAGKSTLLKLLSRITAPTTGNIKVRGRIASLLEVGTGFHPELTGRENIYMNGSIMGMTKREIDSKLDEIVDFAGVERYLETPAKRYSSGMTVRLGFAIAAFLEPEILVVDEVLAVGDAEFQKKAIGKMNDVASKSGRTVLFVSHNMASVRSLCRHGVVLKNGMVEYTGTADECVDFYTNTNISDLIGHTAIEEKHHRNNVTREAEYLDVRLLNDPTSVGNQEPLKFEMKMRRNSAKLKEVQFGVFITNASDQCVCASYSAPTTLKEDCDLFTVQLTLNHHNLAKGTYKVKMNISRFDYTANARDYDLVTDVLSFEVKYLDALHTLPFTTWARTIGNSCAMDTEVKIL